MDKILSIISLFSVVWSNILLIELIEIGATEYFSGLPGSNGGRRTLVARCSARSKVQKSQAAFQ